MSDSNNDSSLFSKEKKKRKGKIRQGSSSSLEIVSEFK